MDLVVLARYMQVLLMSHAKILLFIVSISITHFSRVSRVLALTIKRSSEASKDRCDLHYVTTDLDEGPIIDQEVARVDHTFGPEQLLATGRNMENYALSRAVTAHSEHRVFLNGHKTVVLK